MKISKKLLQFWDLLGTRFISNFSFLLSSLNFFLIPLLTDDRIHSDEGQMGLKAKQELREVDKLIEDLSKQSLNSSTLVVSSPSTSRPKTSILPQLTFQARYSHT